MARDELYYEMAEAALQQVKLPLHGFICQHNPSTKTYVASSKAKLK
jgi:hypothetical protein